MLDILLILFLSFAPMILYAVVLWWLDRYEKEPLGLLVTAFLWGAIPSIILALIMQVMLDIPIVAISSNQLMYNLLGASVIAPITEEGVKALSLLLLLLVIRREIDSPIDGLIYGGMVGFGFAAVENVLYLYGAYAEGGIGDVWSLAFLRAGIFGLNHAMYTGFAGLGVALSLEFKQKWLKPLPIVARHRAGNAHPRHAQHVGNPHRTHLILHAHPGDPRGLGRCIYSPGCCTGSVRSLNASALSPTVTSWRRTGLSRLRKSMS